MFSKVPWFPTFFLLLSAHSSSLAEDCSARPGEVYCYGTPTKQKLCDDGIKRVHGVGIAFPDNVGIATAGTNSLITNNGPIASKNAIINEILNFQNRYCLKKGEIPLTAANITCCETKPAIEPPPTDIPVKGDAYP